MCPPFTHTTSLQSYNLNNQIKKDCYDKISEIINFLKSLKVFNYKLENIDKTLFKVI